MTDLAGFKVSTAPGF